MTQEERQLLLKDLCARLPYGVKTSSGHGTLKLSPRTDVIYVVDNGLIPYLCPLSSMTSDEKKEFNSLMNKVEERCINAYGKGGYTLAFTELNDWLNSHHFDYRGLIEKDLALEAPKGMYKTE
jgi:hypothetical protein